LLSNEKVDDIEIDWQHPNLNRFENGKKVVVLTHGWYAVDQWLKDGVDIFSQYQDVNYIRLQWNGGAEMDDYFLASANTQIAGRAITYLVNTLRTYGFQWEFHCVGHSLGAHVCGYAAKYARDEFNFLWDRVTGLDPAGPLFENSYVEVRLDHTDATFVDIIHTNKGSTGSGITQNIGHADFHPNGGKQVNISLYIFTYF